MDNLLRRVNVGCGPTPIPGWNNYDNSLSVRLAKYPWLVFALTILGLLVESQKRLISVAVKCGIVWSDVTKHIPLPNNSIEALYTSHMIEHLDREDARLFLQETYRVLAPKGIIRIVAPDLRTLVGQYTIDGDADLFIQKTYLARQRPKTFLDRLKYLIIGDRHHLWMYDGPSICRLLSAMGFNEPRILEPGSTIIAEPGELDLYERESESVYVEAYK